MSRLLFASYDRVALLADYHAPALHAHLCSHLAIALEGQLTCVTNEGTTESTGVFIGSDVAHTIQCDSPELIFLFDETSAVGTLVRDNYLHGTAVAPASEELVDRMRTCLATHPDPAAYEREAMQILFGPDAPSTPGAHGDVDPRIAEALAWLHAQDGIGHDVVDQLAARSYLSKSRLSHLFRQEMGISLRRYLAFVKMKKAAQYAAEGMTLTDAAIRAGFDSSSHLSSTVKRMFGISLTDVMRSMQS